MKHKNKKSKENLILCLKIIYIEEELLNNILLMECFGDLFIYINYEYLILFWKLEIFIK